MGKTKRGKLGGRSSKCAKQSVGILAGEVKVSQVQLG